MRFFQALSTKVCRAKKPDDIVTLRFSEVIKDHAKCYDYFLISLFCTNYSTVPPSRIFSGKFMTLYAVNTLFGKWPDSCQSKMAQ